MEKFDEFFFAAVIKWGEESQIGMAIEECAELIVAARKLSRVGGRVVSPTALEAFVDEIADVTIMMRQMALLVGVACVEERIAFKVARLSDRLNSKTN